MSEWLPIESAPTGSLVTQPKGSYVDEMWESPVVLLFDPKWGIITGSWDEDAISAGAWMDNARHSLTLRPTHWMPLPKPPKESD